MKLFIILISIILYLTGGIVFALKERIRAINDKTSLSILEFIISILIYPIIILGTTNML